jgi:hypothetical protein
MGGQLLITAEILLAVVSPLLILYLKSKWPLRATIPCLVVLPLVWYLTYALLHELAHVAGTLLAGGTVVDYRLIPPFWRGEFGRAWITTDGLSQVWQQMLSTTFPYLMNIICIVVGVLVLKRGISRNPFLVGLVFMLLVLRPAFDFLSELTGFLSPQKGDYHAICEVIGTRLVWVYIIGSLALSLVSVVVILRRFIEFPEASPGTTDAHSVRRR